MKASIKVVLNLGPGDPTVNLSLVDPDTDEQLQIDLGMEIEKTSLTAGMVLEHTVTITTDPIDVRLLP